MWLQPLAGGLARRKHGLVRCTQLMGWVMATFGGRIERTQLAVKIMYAA